MNAFVGATQVATPSNGAGMPRRLDLSKTRALRCAGPPWKNEYVMRRLILALCCSLCVCAASPTLAAQAVAPAAAQRVSAFAAADVDRASGRVRIDLATLPGEFLMVATLERAIGSNDIGLDRAQNVDPVLVEFRRAGKRALLVQKNMRFVARSDDADEAAATRDAFAEAVLWSGDIASDAVGRQWIDIGGLVASDLIGVADRLDATKQGKHALAADRSAVLAEDTRVFPDNVEFAALLTFTGDGQGAFARQAAADARRITVKQRVSFVRLPDAGYRPRAYHPGSGAYSHAFFDFAQPIDRNLEVRLQPRFRLEKIDPGAARSRVKKPIVFYLDRGTPEPIRSALLEGANWWKAAFESAGFIDAFRAELAPEGMSMSDVRYNTITWTHRATRGWSYGGGLVDPRTGEIIKGYVNLGSQRVRQDLLIAEGLLAPHRPGADPALMTDAKRMALDRLKQLSAHEIGHALGFAHNFAASRTGEGSVLDYPHPMIELGADGQPRLAAAYRTGTSDWDHFLVAYGYGDVPPEREAEALAQLRAAIAAKGYAYVSDPDARVGGDVHAEGVLWDIPGDPLEGLGHLLRVRKAALARFAEGALPADRQNGDAERRLVPIYLLHRYQTEAAMRLLGGGEYRYGLIGDKAGGVRTTDGARQAKALSAASMLLSLDVLSLPPSVLAVLSPPSNEYARGPEYIDTRMAPVFDPVQAAAVASALVAQQGFHPARLNRLAWQHGQDAAVPSPAGVFDALVARPWRESSAAGQGALLQSSRNWTMLDAALLALDGGELHPGVAAQWRASLRAFADAHAGAKDADRQAAAAHVRRYLDNPASMKLRPLPTIPPGAPI
jgi:hypothetical protein